MHVNIYTSPPAHSSLSSGQGAGCVPGERRDEVLQPDRALSSAGAAECEEPRQCLLLLLAQPPVHTNIAGTLGRVQPRSQQNRAAYSPRKLRNCLKLPAETCPGVPAPALRPLAAASITSRLTAAFVRCSEQ